jgi:hypothetical protein
MLIAELVGEQEKYTVLNATVPDILKNGNIIIISPILALNVQVREKHHVSVVVEVVNLKIFKGLLFNSGAMIQGGNFHILTQ